MSSSPLDAHLRAMRSHLVPRHISAGRQFSDRYEALSELVGGEVRQQSSGAFVVVTTLYPYGFRYGEIVLEKQFGEATLPLSSIVMNDQGREVHPSQIRVIDTETTGLGGAGTVPFLVGVGAFTNDGFEIVQYLMPDYSDERGMLDSILCDLGDSAAIVSYNGAAFDIPIIHDRVIINRCDRKLAPICHIDMLHASRRLFRRRLKDCSLINLEKALFDYERGDDIPGYLIPSTYFDWVSNGNASAMPDVLKHNRHDILSLCLLLFHLKEIVDSNGGTLCQVDDLYSLSRVYGRRKELGRSLIACDRIRGLAGADLSDEILLHHGIVCKKLGKYDMAISMWREAAAKDHPASRESLRAEEELAKMYEHRLGDLASAAFHAARYVEKAGKLAMPIKHVERGRARIERIARKRASA